MAETKFYLNPNAKDSEVFLGPTEAKLMEIAWEQKEITVKKALFYLSDNDKKAYTTVMTVLSRLADKSLLSKRKDGKTFIYKPILSKKEFIKARVKTVSSCLKQFK